MFLTSSSTHPRIELGFEGVVAKRLDSRYTPGWRSAAWITHKLRRWLDRAYGERPAVA
jgi:ATP-dependent DNA ligase